MKTLKEKLKQWRSPINFDKIFSTNQIDFILKEVKKLKQVDMYAKGFKIGWDKAEERVFGLIDWEINDCKTLIRLEEDLILNAKTHKAYKSIVANAQGVLEKKYALYRLKQLKQKIKGEKE